MLSPKYYRKRQMGNGRTEYVHRLVWAKAYGAIPKGHHIDHINGDIHDNRLENLRLSTVSQNIANSKLSTANKSGLKGLHWDSSRSLWKGEVKVNRKSTGKRGDLLEVAAWLFRTRKELHGEFARP